MMVLPTPTKALDLVPMVHIMTVNLQWMERELREEFERFLSLCVWNGVIQINKESNFAGAEIFLQHLLADP